METISFRQADEWPASAVRRVVYTTNAIESVHSQLRKIIKTRGHFPSVSAASRPS